MFSNPFFMRLTFLAILILSLNLNNYAQTSIGLKTGINFSKAVYLNDYSEELVNPFRKLKPGFISGIVIHQSLNKILSVQAEVLYSQKGLKVTQQPHSTTINSMNYIEIPLTGHYSIIKNKYSSFDLYIGGYSAYWIGGKYKRTDLITDKTGIVKVDFNNPDYTYSRIDYGLLSGAVFKAEKADFYIRYTYSMTGSSQINTDALSNRVISVGINYKILK